NDVGTRKHEQVVVAAQLLRMVGEPRAPEVRLAEAVTLNHRAHRAVEHEDAARQLVAQADGRGTAPGSLLRLACLARPSGLRPLATSTVNGSPFSRAPTSTRTSTSPACDSRLSSLSSLKPSHWSPSLLFTHS